jgi:prolyl-tRNA editing enzyme YbaK/EbsC (Cys-tRNA(Pro) deacylase)
MTEPATELHPDVKNFLDRSGIIYRVFNCNPELADTAVFCEHYGFLPRQAANTIITASKTDPVQFACCIVLGNCKLDVNKKVCQLLGVKKASFASSEQTVQLTGMMIGGVTPFGLPDMPIFIDSAVLGESEVVLGGGNRSSKVLLAPAELTKLPSSQVVEGLAAPKE